MKTYHWAVVGAGPAGIAAVGKLLDHGVSGKEIIWIDPSFTVGDFGSIWRHVPSNTKVDLFLKFLQSCDAFSYATCTENFALNHAPRDQTCYLSLMAEPLQWVTKQLQSKVHSILGRVTGLTRTIDEWQLHLVDSTIAAHKIILAIGAEPKTLSLEKTIIPLSDALDKERLQKHLQPNDTVGIFGSSHSAILVLRHLIEHSAKRVINFYRSPLLYAIYYDNYILHDDTGLKGTTAEWARAHLEGALPPQLQRIESNQENINTYLPLCDKVIYAIGFLRRPLQVNGVAQLNFEDPEGNIAPGLFGFGIAFPEMRANPMGVLEQRVGLWKFMDYLQRVMPKWLVS